MTSEKKPPQWADGLRRQPQAVNPLDLIPGKAHVVISIDADGTLQMRTFCFNREDSLYANRPDSALLGPDLRQAVAELRLQVREDRNVTLEESNAFRRHYFYGEPLQASSGSAVTV